MRAGGRDSAVPRLPIVGVMGSHQREHARLADPLGEGIARMGAHLLTGGGPGVMARVSRAFAQVSRRRGLSIGVVPMDPDKDGASPRGYPNAWVEVPIRTHLGAKGVPGESLRSRNSVNILSSDVVVALPGGVGTRSEVRLCLRFAKSALLLGDHGAWGEEMRGVQASMSVSQALEFVSETIKQLGASKAGVFGPANGQR